MKWYKDRKWGSVAVTLVLIFGIGFPAIAQEPMPEQPAEDQEGTEAADVADGTDEGEAKKEKKGPSIIPVPIFITEPAIGYGLGGAVGYFHKKKNQADPGADSHPPAFTADTTKVGKQQKVPPTISGVAAAYTEKGTWGVGFAHTASWKKDTIRYTGALGYAHIVSTFYFNNRPFDFELDTGLLVQDLKFRIASSNFFVGGKLAYITPKLLFDEDVSEIPDIEDRQQLNDFGLALQTDWDGRDNKMTPNSGQFVEFVVWKHIEALGGETDYWKIGLQAQSFHELANKKLVLGFHLDLDIAGGDPPIWAYPWITMRGIPALRYQNESTAVLDTELRWNIFERWAAVGFIGVGATRGDVLIYDDESGIVAGGVGGRFLFRPQDSLWVGLDVAKGPEDYVLYVQVGQAW